MTTFLSFIIIDTFINDVSRSFLNSIVDAEILFFVIE